MEDEYTEFLRVDQDRRVSVRIGVDVHLEDLVASFKDFVLAAGYHENLVREITYTPPQAHEEEE